MRLLFISNLFPDRSEPYRGLDNAIVLRHLSQAFDIRVISPRPTLPLPGAAKTRVPRLEDESFRPTYPPVRYIPKVGSRVNHRLFARGLGPAVEAVRREFPFEVILCSWAYPDTWAVARIARRMVTPFVSIVQGTDVHSYLEMPVRRRLIVEGLSRAEAVIARSGDLGRRLERAGVPSERLHTVYNGVDGAVFKPGDRTAAREELGLPPDAEIVLFVGNFYAVKNPLLTVAAHAEWTKKAPRKSRFLVMVGGGPMEREVRATVRHWETEDRVVLAGRQTSARVARYMQAADCLLLTSHNEGLPNVVLEALSCGLPVVATDVGGISEVIDREERGRLVGSREPHEIAAAVESVLNRKPKRSGISPVTFSWTRTATRYEELIRLAVARRGF